MVETIVLAEREHTSYEVEHGGIVAVRFVVACYLTNGEARQRREERARTVTLIRSLRPPARTPGIAAVQGRYVKTRSDLPRSGCAVDLAWLLSD